jgi:hypothetical protein
VALGVASENHLAQTGALDQSGSQQVVAVGKRTDRVVEVSADDQGAFHIGLGRQTLI